jgi:hypothetical protein
MLIAIAFAASTSLAASNAAPDPIAAALDGLTAVIEQDGRPDVRLLGMRTRGCQTQVRAPGKRWTINWRHPAAVSLQDSFVFVDAAPVRIAIVADASRPDQAARLRSLSSAMQATARRCAPARLRNGANADTR